MLALDRRERDLRFGLCRVLLTFVLGSHEAHRVSPGRGGRFKERFYLMRLSYFWEYFSFLPCEKHARQRDEVATNSQRRRRPGAYTSDHEDACHETERQEGESKTPVQGGRVARAVSGKGSKPGAKAALALRTK
jgi:hypothetical protein